MSMNHQFVGSYNTRKAELELQHRRAIEAKRVLADRRSVIDDLVAATFWRVSRSNRRSQRALGTAYDTAAQLAMLGGQEYTNAVKALKQAAFGPVAYAEACAAMLIPVDD